MSLLSWSVKHLKSALARYMVGDAGAGRPWVLGLSLDSSRHLVSLSLPVRHRAGKLTSQRRLRVVVAAPYGLNGGGREAPRE